MYGVETYKQLPRSVPKYLQGIRLAEGSRSPQQIRREAEGERALQSHPVRGGATRNDRIWLGASHPTTFAKASIEGEAKPFPWVALAIVVGVIVWANR
jgi:hypothetical protein